MKLAGKQWMIYVGRDYYRARGYCIEIGVGIRVNAKAGEIPFSRWHKYRVVSPIILSRRNGSICIEYGIGMRRRSRVLKMGAA